MAHVTGTFAATGPSASLGLRGKFALHLSGTFVATVGVEASTDGSNWVPVARDATGTAATYTTPIRVSGEDPERVLYRLNCTAYTSGTVSYRLGQ